MFKELLQEWAVSENINFVLSKNSLLRLFKKDAPRKYFYAKFFDPSNYDDSKQNLEAHIKYF